MPKTHEITCLTVEAEIWRRIKERTNKGSVGPFCEAQYKGYIEPQYEKGIRGNANFDSTTLSGQIIQSWEMLF